jgi:hypothetical protein
VFGLFGEVDEKRGRLSYLSRTHQGRVCGKFVAATAKSQVKSTNHLCIKLRV